MNIDKIKKNIIIINDCWIWQKSCSSSGYGQLTENKIYWNAHVYAYVCVNGLLPINTILRHTCHNKKCCNPNHLIPGTKKDNWNDSKQTHLSAASKRRQIWRVNGITYPTCREAVKATGISMSSIIKYTKDGIFNMTLYKAKCVKGKRH